MRFCITRAQNYKKNQRNQRIAQKRKSGAKTSDSCDSFLGTFSKKSVRTKRSIPFHAARGIQNQRNQRIAQKRKSGAKTSDSCDSFLSIFSKISPDEAKHPFPCGKGHSGKSVFKKGYKDL